MRPTPDQGAPQQVFRSGNPLLHPRPFLLYAWRDLRDCGEVARRTWLESLAAKYRHSYFGVAWAFLPAVLIVLVVTLGQRAQVPGLLDAAVPAQVQAVLGLILFQSFIEALQVQRNLFKRHAWLISRQRVPIEGLMTAAAGEALFAFLVRLPVLGVTMLYFSVTPAITLPVALLGMLMLVALGSAIGMLLAPWSALSRDIDSMLSVLPWLVLITTPVFVSVESAGQLQGLYRLSPLAHVFEAVRAWTLGVGDVSPLALALLLSALPLLAIAWLMMRLTKPQVIERSLV